MAGERRWPGAGVRAHPVQPRARSFLVQPLGAAHAVSPALMQVGQERIEQARPGNWCIGINSPTVSAMAQRRTGLRSSRKA